MKGLIWEPGIRRGVDSVTGNSLEETRGVERKVQGPCYTHSSSDAKAMTRHSFVSYHFGHDFREAPRIWGRLPYSATR